MTKGNENGQNSMLLADGFNEGEHHRLIEGHDAYAENRQPGRLVERSFQLFLQSGRISKHHSAMTVATGGRDGPKDQEEHGCVKRDQKLGQCCKQQDRQKSKRAGNREQAVGLAAPLVAIDKADPAPDSRRQM